MTAQALELRPGRAATVAGIGYLIILIFTLGNLVLQDLIVPGHALTSINNIAGSELSFRIGIVSWIVVIAADAVVAWALYVYLEPVSRSYSMLTALLRLVFVVIVAGVLVNLLSVLPVIGATGIDRALAALSLAPYEFGFNVAFVFFGLHVLGLGYLILKSDHIPKVLGVLLAIASAGYLIDSFASLLSPGYAANGTLFMIFVAVPALIGEYSMALWLLVKGRKLELVERRA